MRGRLILSIVAMLMPPLVEGARWIGRRLFPDRAPEAPKTPPEAPRPPRPTPPPPIHPDPMRVRARQQPPETK